MYTQKDSINSRSQKTESSSVALSNSTVIGEVLTSDNRLVGGLIRPGKLATSEVLFFFLIYYVKFTFFNLLITYLLRTATYLKLRSQGHHFWDQIRSPKIRNVLPLSRPLERPKRNLPTHQNGLILDYHQIGMQKILQNTILCWTIAN